MRSSVVNGKARLLSWRRMRDYAVPASMIETATARRVTGDWAGACAAAHVDVDLDFRAVTRARGQAFAGMLRADLRRLAPDLLRWHLPRVGPDALLRPGLTMSLARYAEPGWEAHLVVRTAPAWADSGQRLSLALWDPAAASPGPHPRPRPDQRFRLDLHRHLWAADRVTELPERCGIASGAGLEARAGSDSPEGPRSERCTADVRLAEGWTRNAWQAEIPAGFGYAVHRWRAEAAILRAAGRHTGPVVVRLRGGRRLLIGTDDRNTRFADARERTTAPVLPHAATHLPLDVELLQAGLISTDELHPLLAETLRPRTVGTPGKQIPESAAPTGFIDGVRLVECRGESHRLGLVDGVLVPLDHPAAELRREELLAVLGGPQLPCLRVIATEAREPDRLDEIRARLDHGDHAGALAVVESLLGPGARLPEGALLDAFTDATEARIAYGLYRAGLSTRVPAWANAEVPAWMRVAPRLRSARTGRSSRTGRPARAGRSGRVNRVRRLDRADGADRAGRRGLHHRLPNRAVTSR
jgi:hypothetical protein